MALEKIYSLLVKILPTTFTGFFLLIMVVSFMLLPIMFIIYSTHLISKFLDNYLLKYFNDPSNKKFLLKYSILFLYFVVVCFLYSSLFNWHIKIENVSIKKKG